MSNLKGTAKPGFISSDKKQPVVYQSSTRVERVRWNTLLDLREAHLRSQAIQLMKRISVEDLHRLFKVTVIDPSVREETIPKPLYDRLEEIDCIQLELKITI